MEVKRNSIILKRKDIRTSLRIRPVARCHITLTDYRPFYVENITAGRKKRETTIISDIMKKLDEILIVLTDMKSALQKGKE